MPLSDSETPVASEGPSAKRGEFSFKPGGGRGSRQRREDSYRENVSSEVVKGETAIRGHDGLDKKYLSLGLEATQLDSALEVTETEKVFPLSFRGVGANVALAYTKVKSV